MEAISGQYIRTILSIKQGRGFGHLSLTQCDGIFVEATLNGSSLETDIVPLAEEPIFDSELMWESDKKSLRRLRTGSAIIKVQCFSADHSHMKRDRIGNFIIALRQAHIVPSGKSFVDIGESWWEWQKLNGAKTPCPELLCSLRLEGRPKAPEMPITQPAKTRSNRQKQQIIQPFNHNLITRLHPDKGIIQIGSDETAIDNFVLIIYVGQAVNLDLLLPGNYNSENSSENEQLCFHYSIMDYAINTANIAMSDIYKPVPLNEKMVISLCSSLENLQQYFSTSSKLEMKLMIGQDEIGFTEMSMQELVPTTNKTAFCDLDEDNTVTIESPCFLKGYKTGDVPTSPSGLQPYVNLRIRLKYQEIEWKNMGQGEGQLEDSESEPARLLRSSSYTILDIPSQPMYKVPTVDFEDSNAKNDVQSVGLVIQHGFTGEILNQDPNRTTHVNGSRQASGDVVEEAENMTQLLKELKMPSGQGGKFSASSSQLRLPCTHIINKSYHSEPVFHDNSTQAPERSDKPFHTYSLDIVVESVCFQQLPPQRRCFFKFHHPKAGIMCNSHPEVIIKEPSMDIQLEDIKCKLTFVSTPEQINQLLLAWPPKISVWDSSGGLRNQLAVATLNARPLLVENLKKCQFDTPMINLKTTEVIGVVNVKMTLHDYGSQQLEEKPPVNTYTDQDLGPSILDDQIAFKIVEELEDWKERQQELFKAELKKREQAHLSLLCEEWKKQRMEQEINLNRNVEQCRHLAQSLNETTDELRLKTHKNAEKERELSRYKEVIERKLKLKVLEMKETIRRTEDDLSLKVTKVEREKEDLEHTILRMEKKNSLLKETITAQEQEIDKMKKSSLTKDQTASMLQEMKSMEAKLESALKSKSFFKEQWARAVREIHRIKCEHQQAIQIEMKHNKEEVKNVGLQHLLIEGEKQLQEDQSTLQQIRTQVNAMQSHHGVGDAMQQYPEFVASRLPNTTSLYSLRPGKNLHNALDFTTLKHKSNPTSKTNLNRPSSLQQDENKSRLKALVEERDTLMNTGTYSLEDAVISQLNQEIRSLLIHSNGVT